MQPYILYNNDIPVAHFHVRGGLIQQFTPSRPELLPMQIRIDSADRFQLWLNNRSVDLTVMQHRNLVQILYGSRDKLTLAIETHMISISDTFTCFKEGEQFVPRSCLFSPEGQMQIKEYLLVSSASSLRQTGVSSPNISTDGSFAKTWVYENGIWWLWKIQSADATKSEVEISKVLRAIGWNAAEYRYIGSFRKRVRCRNFVGENEFFEPYDSLRYLFEQTDDSDETITNNLCSLAPSIARSWKRILAADALFENTDRHMRNFGVIRSAQTGKILRLAPNFDNNQAYRANPGGVYSDGMLKQFLSSADSEDIQNLRLLARECESSPYLKDAHDAAVRLGLT